MQMIHQNDHVEAVRFVYLPQIRGSNESNSKHGGLAPIFVLQNFALQGSLMGMFGAENSKYMGIYDEIRYSPQPYYFRDF